MLRNAVSTTTTARAVLPRLWLRLRPQCLVTSEADITPLLRGTILRAAHHLTVTPMIGMTGAIPIQTTETYIHMAGDPELLLALHRQ